MAKAEWGLKRSCQSCGAHFYDLNRHPILCPKCGAQFDAEALLRPRRTKAVARPEPEEVAVPEPAVEAAEAETEGDAEVEVVMEDTSELGEDEEDVAGVVEGVEKED